MELIEVLRSAKRALVLGVGGGGDVVATVPTARLLDALGIPSVLGGLSWERFVYDPEPGTRTLEEVVEARALAPTVWLANARTATVSGVRFAESEVAAVFGCETVLVDLSRGVGGVVDGLRAALEALDADLLIGIDVGGDSLAHGEEAGLRSPLADAMMLAAMDALSAEVATLWGVIGYGSDGELTTREIDARLASLAANGGLVGAWGLTPGAVAQMQRLIERVRTEASEVVLRAARGALGETAIRDGTRIVQVSPQCTVTYYLDPRVLAASTPLAGAVAGCPSLAAASEALTAMGIRTEYAFEQEMQRRGLARYPSER